MYTMCPPGCIYTCVLFNVNDNGNFGFERSSRRGNFGILLSGTHYILVLLLLLRSLESGFHTITAIVTIAEIELKGSFFVYRMQMKHIVEPLFVSYCILVQYCFLSFVSIILRHLRPVHQVRSN